MIRGKKVIHSDVSFIGTFDLYSEPGEKGKYLEDWHSNLNCRMILLEKSQMNHPFNDLRLDRYKQLRGLMENLTPLYGLQLKSKAEILLLDQRWDGMVYHRGLDRYLEDEASPQHSDTEA